MLEDKTLVLHSDLLSVISGILNGIGFVAALIFIQLSIRRNGAPLTTTFNRLGILIPTILSALLFLEIPAPVQIAGLILCSAAILLMNSGGKEERPAFVFGLLAIFILGGTLDFVSKVYSRYYGADNQTCFVLYTFLAALAVSVLLFLRDGGLYRLSHLQRRADHSGKCHQLPGIPGTSDPQAISGHRHDRPGPDHDQSFLKRPALI